MAKGKELSEEEEINLYNKICGMEDRVVSEKEFFGGNLTLLIDKLNNKIKPQKSKSLLDNFKKTFREEKFYYEVKENNRVYEVTFFPEGPYFIINVKENEKEKGVYFINVEQEIGSVEISSRMPLYSIVS